jgi:hypothetical protein
MPLHPNLSPSAGVDWLGGRVFIDKCCIAFGILDKPAPTLGFAGFGLTWQKYFICPTAVESEGQMVGEMEFGDYR